MEDKKKIVKIIITIILLGLVIYAAIMVINKKKPSYRGLVG